MGIDKNGDRYILGGFADSVEISPGVQLLSEPNDNSEFLMKVNKKNELIWYKQLEVFSLISASVQLKTDKDGSVVLIGTFGFSIKIDGNTVAQGIHWNDIFVMRFSAQGDFEWCRGFGGYGNNSLTGAALDDFGNIYTTGTYQGDLNADPGVSDYTLPWTGQQNSFVHKLDKNGNFVWAKGLNATQWIYSKDVLVDAKGDICIVGIFSGTADFDPNPIEEHMEVSSFTHAFLLSLSDDGEFIAVKKIGYSSYWSVFFMAEDSHGNIIVSYKATKHGLIKFKRETGEVLKMMNTGSKATISDMEIDKQDNVYLAGYFYDTLELIYRILQPFLFQNGVWMV